jgi:ribosomal protein L37E
MSKSIHDDLISSDALSMGKTWEDTMKPCRECKQEISEQAISCPHCGAPYPAGEKGDGRGFEYKSEAAFFGLPLVHISFKYARIDSLLLLKE